MGSQQGSSSAGPVSAGSIGSMAPQGSLSLSAASGSASGSSSLVTTQPASTSSSLSTEHAESSKSESSKSESSGESSKRRRRCRNKKSKKCLYQIKEIEHLHPEIKAILPPREQNQAAPADDKQGFFKFSEQINVKSVGIPDAISVGGEEGKQKRKAGLDTHFQLTSQTPDVMKYDRDFDLSHGLSPTMSVSTIQIRKAQTLLPDADKKHYDFEDQHKKDCALPVCVKKGPE